MIAERTGVTTIADFRPADMAAGGQGAPLVPFVDYLLYRHPKRSRVALNIGGIANVTVIPAGAKPKDVFAFDTGPGNMIVDALVEKFTHGRARYDKDSEMALRGWMLPKLLNEMMEHPYLHKEPPKTAGREQFGRAYAEKILAWGKKHRAKPADVVRTATIFTSLSIGNRISEIHFAANAGGRVDRVRRRRAQYADDGLPCGDPPWIFDRFIRSFWNRARSEGSFGVCDSGIRKFSWTAEQFALCDGRSIIPRFLESWFMGARDKLRRRLAVLAFLTLLIPAGCSYFRQESDPNTLVFLMEAAPTNLDPRIGADAYSAHLDGLIFSSLVAHDAQMNVIPDLAERWETPDPLTYVFHLRHGVKFHDGRELTSADVKFTFDTIISGAVKTPKRGQFRLVTSTDAPDAYTFVFHLREPYASFLFGLVAAERGNRPARFACWGIATSDRKRAVSLRKPDKGRGNYPGAQP